MATIRKRGNSWQARHRHRREHRRLACLPESNTDEIPGKNLWDLGTFISEVLEP